MTKKPKQESHESYPLDDVLVDIARVLDAQQIGYVIIGGQAVIFHGHVRWTGDIDIELAISSFDAAPLLDQLAAMSLEPKFPDYRELIKFSQLLPCKHIPSSYGVDFAFVDSDYTRTCIQNAVCYEIAGYPVNYAKVEDIVIRKVIAFRDQDRTDLLALVNRHPHLDQVHVRQWLSDFEPVTQSPLLDRFDAIQNELGLNN